MKNILILFDGEPSDASPIDSLGYSALYTYLTKNDLQLCRAPISYFDVPSKKFTQAQFFIDGSWVWKKNITPDMVYDKSPYYTKSSEMKTREIIAKNFTFFNSLKLSRILSNKFLTFNFFEKFSAKTVLIKTVDQIDSINALQTPEIICKPLSQSGGLGIFISPKETAAADILSHNSFPILAQEFKDSSHAKNEFIEGFHDVRVIIINQTPFYTYVRTPQKNSRIANVSTGATLKVIPTQILLYNTVVNKFIQQIMDTVDNIDNTNKLYAIDFMFDNNNKLWLIEMNSRPGLTLEQSEKPFQDEFYKNLVTFFN